MKRGSHDWLDRNGSVGGLSAHLCSACGTHDLEREVMARVIILGDDDAKGGGTKSCQCKHNVGNLGCACTNNQWFAPGKVPKKYICGECSKGNHQMWGPKH